jgi:hypothetical protein
MPTSLARPRKSARQPSTGNRPEHPNTRRDRAGSGRKTSVEVFGSPVRAGVRDADPNTHDDDNAVQQLLRDPRLLDSIKAIITARGYAGDVRPPLLVYVALTSRLLTRPLNLALVSPSATGKNYAVDSARALVPPHAVYFVSAGSQKALVYAAGDFKHRVVIFAEADSIPDEGPAGSAVRALAADNQLVYEVVEKNGEKYETRRIQKEGPTGLITTSTKKLPHQMNTRVLEVWVNDSPAQTREIIRAQARAELPGAVAALPGAASFVALQRWLENHGSHQVVVPFSEQLAELVPIQEPRTRRDFQQLLTVIKTSALLHQLQRQRTAAGEIVATFDDYANARWLLSAIFDAISEDGVTPAIRETVEAVERGNGTTQAVLVKRLGLSKAAVSERVQRAVSKGYLVREGGKGQAAHLRRGEPLPDADTALPPVEALKICSGEPVARTVSRTPKSNNSGLHSRETPQPFGCSGGFPTHGLNGNGALSLRPEHAYDGSAEEFI